MTIPDEAWDAWAAPRTVDVELPSTGRPARLHETLRVADVVRQGLWTDAVGRFILAVARGEDVSTDEAVAASDRLVCAMFVRPRVVLDEAWDAAAAAIPISRLDDREIDDVIALAFGGRELADRFRVDRAAAAAGRNGDGDAPEQPARREPPRPRNRPRGAGA